MSRVYINDIIICLVVIFVLAHNILIIIIRIFSFEIKYKCECVYNTTQVTYLGKYNVCQI